MPNELSIANIKPQAAPMPYAAAGQSQTPPSGHAIPTTRAEPGAVAARNAPGKSPREALLKKFSTQSAATNGATPSIPTATPIVYATAYAEPMNTSDGKVSYGPDDADKKKAAEANATPAAASTPPEPETPAGTGLSKEEKKQLNAHIKHLKQMAALESARRSQEVWKKIAENADAVAVRSAKQSDRWGGV